jgi:hypothetical protein
MNENSKTSKERKVLAGFIELLTHEDSFRKKQYLYTIIGIFTSLALCIYIYFDAEQCFQYYKKGLLLSFFAGVTFIWSVYSYVNQLAARTINAHFKPYIDLDKASRRYVELGGDLEKKPDDYKVALFKYLRNTLIWALIFTALFLMLKFLKH